jgi:hypothetical protein
VVECHSILEFKKMRQNQQQTFFKRVTLFLVKSDLCQKIQKSAALLHCTALLHCCTAALLHCCTAADGVFKGKKAAPKSTADTRKVSSIVDT